MESMEREIYILYYAVPDKIIFCKGFIKLENKRFCFM